MIDPQISASLVPSLTALAVGYWMKSHLKKVDQITTLMNKVDGIAEKLTEIKSGMDKFDTMRDEFILLKAETKTQWARIDDVAKRMRDV